MGSWRLIIAQSIVLAVWVVLNVVAWIDHWDPYPFILMNLALSFQAAYAAPFIMISHQLGNDIAIKAFRGRKLPFPDGTIIAALHWNEASSDENNKVLAIGFPGAGLQIIRCAVRPKCSVHGQGLKEV